MNFLFGHSDLRDLHDKVAAGRRLSEADALRLFESKDLNALGAIADGARQRQVGNHASYILNRYLNYSNYCILSCQFCSFARKKRDRDGFELSIEDMVRKAREALALGITELHIVGGLHPSLPFSYYTDMLKALRTLDGDRSAAVPAASAGSGPLPEHGNAGDSRTRTVLRSAGGDACATPTDGAPKLHLKCFTAIEILHLAWLARKSVEQTLIELKEAGLSCLTGGGAEIFAPKVRSAIAKGKESAAEYLDVHRTWHRLGGRSTCTMLYGHVETLADRVDHLRQLRELQDETGGFVGFIPLPYQPDNNEIPVTHPPTGYDTLRTLAVSRLFLDNFDHLTAYWVGLGMKLAQVALSYGADDLHGTIVEEHIFHMAGAASPQLQTEAEMIKAIREAGRTPLQRNTFYEPIKVWDAAPTATEAELPSGRSKVLEDNLATA
ncbi:MAG: radical SAM protein [Verrucomicrobia bacterium]|nr:radical SAM protein [Verrucomicrobiota bacterium]